jgi:TonB family protein
MAVPITIKVYKGDQLVAAKDYDRDIIKIGRLSSAHLCLDDEKVSRIHSVIEVAANGALSIVDMGSVEGTFVNGKRVNKGPVSAGDEIRVGNTILRVQPRTAAAAADLPSADSPEVAQAPIPGEQRPELGAPPRLPPEEAPVAIGAARVDRSPKARARSSKTAGSLGLELCFMWGDHRVGEFFIKPRSTKAFSVGTAPGVDFITGDANLNGPKFEIVRADNDGFQLRFTNRLNGELHRNGAPLQLKQLIETGQVQHDGDAYSLSLDGDDFAWVDLGAVRLEVSIQSVPKPVFVPFFETVDFTALNIFLLMFFLASLFVITSLNRNLEGEGYKDELSSTQARIAKLIIKPPQIQQNPFLKMLQKKKNQGEIAAKHRGEEGQMGKKDAPKRDARAAPKGDPNNKDQARLMAQNIFGKSGKGISTIFGHNGLGGELKSAMGNMFGTTAGDARGFGGLGLKGSGSGGGGTGDTIGIGGIGTKGRGGGVGSYGSGAGMLGGKKAADIGITSSDPVVMGSLDKELIRRVIHANRNQIRYCYESQLTRYPKLSGKVAVKFIITAAGTVASSQVAQSTAGNSELETCVAGRVHTWIFPKPKGGGVVIVTYPFIFKPSGE